VSGGKGTSGKFRAVDLRYKEDRGAGLENAAALAGRDSLLSWLVVGESLLVELSRHDDESETFSLLLSFEKGKWPVEGLRDCLAGDGDRVLVVLLFIVFKDSLEAASTFRSLLMAAIGSWFSGREADRWGVSRMGEPTIGISMTLGRPANM
jgi:hypothetical protein